MSAKSILLISSLLIILSSQNTIVWAGYSSPSIAEEDEIEAAQSMKSMRSLLDLDYAAVPLSEVESPSPMTNFTWMTEEALDKQEIPGLSSASFLTTDLQDEISSYQLSRRVGFTPSTGAAEEIRDSLKKESWIESIEKYLEKLAPYLDYRYEVPN